MKQILLFGAMIVAAACVNAGVARSSEVAPKGLGDTITVSSSYLSEPMKVTVVPPAGYSAPGDTTRYPVLYLLNGHGGNYRNWSTIVDLDSMATTFGCIIVCPSGMNSWYWDSPIDPGMQMESFIIKTLIPHIDANYRTRTDRLGRSVTGFSMGGHGGLWLGIRHSDIFGSAGSTSGGVNIIPFPERWSMKLRLGEYAENPEVWEAHTVKNLIKDLKPDQIKIVFDCGTSDFFYGVNCDLDSALNAARIPHCFYTAPGGHNGAYWSKSIWPQMQFFSDVWSGK